MQHQLIVQACGFLSVYKPLYLQYHSRLDCLTISFRAEDMYLEFKDNLKPLSGIMSDIDPNTTMSLAGWADRALEETLMCNSSQAAVVSQISNETFRFV